MPPDVKLACRAVIALTALSLAAALLIAYVPPPRGAGLMDTFTTVFKLGMGPIVGLFGGRAVA
jgi:hypothetical protein